jgi:GNAT superfamily N-acetyltransferase
MITCAVELFPPFLEEVKPVFPIHWEELALHKDKVPLDPQYDIYLQKDRDGQILLVVARENGKLIGYFVGFVGRHLHYKSYLTCGMDIFYVLPQHRGSRVGIKLFKTVEAECKRRGIQTLIVGSKLHKDASWLFEYLKYTEVERYYQCWTGE